MNNELGDFQTPLPLVEIILNYLGSLGKQWTRALEPTCGRGNFIEGLLKQARPPYEIQGIEIQPSYYELARKVAQRSQASTVVIRQANLFDLNLRRSLQWSHEGPLLIVGNPPWVTNAELGTLDSDNLPKKSNIKRLNGLDARMGGANFDIAEYIWLKLMKELASEQPTIALLCKTSVARNVLQFAFDNSLPIRHASLYKIDAKKWFGVAVDACLFSVEVGENKSRHYEAAVYSDFSFTEPSSIIGIAGKRLVNGTRSYQQVAHIDGICTLTWRQGVKHDAASVMELTHNDDTLRNKLGEIVAVEREYVYPLLKGSDLFNGRQPHKSVIITQQRLGENTRALQMKAPLLWQYLLAHKRIFEQRKSSIYENQPPFAIFGIGSYSFAPFKVAISGLNKVPKFRAIGPIHGRPVMLDDTCYFIACSSAIQAAFLASLLNDPLCLEFINSIAFLDAKRPITKKVLQRINLKALYQEANKQALLLSISKELEHLGVSEYVQNLQSIEVERLLTDYSSAGESNKCEQYTLDALLSEQVSLVE